MHYGFSLAEVMGMTLAQARAYGAAAERAKLRERRDTLMLLRGAQYDKENFEKLLKALDKGA